MPGRQLADIAGACDGGEGGRGENEIIVDIKRPDSDEVRKNGKTTTNYKIVEEHIDAVNNLLD